MSAERARAYSFDGDDETRWWHDAVRDLVVGLHAFRSDDLYGPTLHSVEQRRDAIATLRVTTLESPAAVEAWSAARAAIAKHIRYDGLDLLPQIGLLPLGENPESGLWEFWHVESGARPERGEAGRWDMTSEAGIVLVLIPGGTFWMGAQSDDEEGFNHDPLAGEDEADGDGDPVEVTLSPYFVSRYELTQPQWERMTGSRPSSFGPGLQTGDRVVTDNNPVERVSWEDCSLWLPRYGLSLPTEAQWEYAARAGTSHPWFTGRERSSIGGAGNVADAFCRDNGGPDNWSYETDLDDGHTVHSAIGMFEPNRFGLHDTIGNLTEWCADRYVDRAYRHPQVSDDGSRALPEVEHRRRVNRGGNWLSDAMEVRSAFRSSNAQDRRANNIGCRPARSIRR